MAVEDRPLTDRIAAAASDVIRAHARSIDRHVDEVKSVTVELAIRRVANGVAIVHQADCYVQRRVSTNETLGIGHGKGGSR